MFEYRGIKISWLGHDSYKISTDKVVYIDPFKISATDKADLVLVSHEHFDHLSPDDLRKVAKETTVAVGPQGCQKQLSDIFRHARSVRAGEKFEISGIKMEAVQAYNVNKFRSPGQPFHPKGLGVGYIVEIGGVRVYHCGDTDHISEMKGINTDVVLIPVSGTYVMTSEEAARAVQDIKPKLAIPMHYGAIVGNIEDAEKFKKSAKCDVKILEKEQ